MAALLRNTTISVLLLISAACSGAVDDALPSRTDCIVKIDMQWPTDMAVSMREKIIDEIGTAILLSAAKGGPDISADLALPRHERDVMYLQFKQACDHRLEHASNLATYVYRTVNRAPTMVVSDQKIEPGPDTIEVWGATWSDQPERD